MSSIKFPFGKYKDRYVCHIVQTNPSYVVWFFENVEGSDKWVTESQYQEAQDGVDYWDEIRNELDGLGGSPEWWKD